MEFEILGVGEGEEMNSVNNEIYEKIVCKSAKKWGIGSVFYDERIPSVEVFTPPDGVARWPGNKIEIFTFNRLWGFSMSVYSGARGHCHGSFLKFCEPYPTRNKALQAAIDKFSRYAKCEKDLLLWASSLIYKQLSLF